MTNNYDDEDSNVNVNINRYTSAEDKSIDDDDCEYVDYFCRLRDEDDEDQDHEDDGDVRHERRFCSSNRRQERSKEGCFNGGNIFLSAYKQELLTDNMMALEQAYKTKNYGFCSPYGVLHGHHGRTYLPPCLPPTTGGMVTSLARTVVEEALNILDGVDTDDEDDGYSINKYRNSRGSGGSGMNKYVGNNIRASTSNH
jgi:hypothetical protein